jgi:Ser/Thr protein kinase RdoA (MazF antagonist)
VDLASSVLQLTGAVTAEAIAAGHQSRVFELTTVDGRRFVAKVLDPSVVELDVVIARVEAVAELADRDPRVCRPIRIADRLVNVVVDEVGRPAPMICFEFADGVAFDVARPIDAALMGETLAGLHQSLACVAARDIPEVAALRAVHSTVDEEFQLLHGDFNSENLRRNGSTVKVFDFEDCGYGPRSFEIANAMYMVLFTATIEREIERYQTFEDAFLTGYATADGRDVDRGTVDQFLDLRVRALQLWLDDLSTAPVGIRTATPQWHETLRSFVDHYERRRP